MRKNIIVCVVFLLLFILGLPVNANSKNLLINGNFQAIIPVGKLSNWDFRVWKVGASANLTPGQTYNHNPILKITTKELNDVWIFQKVKVQPNTYYNLSGWVATETLSGESGANIGLITGEFASSTSLKSNQNWTLLHFDFKTYDGQTEVTVAARLGNWNSPVSGTAYFNQLSLVELDRTPATFQKLVNPQPPIESSFLSHVDWLGWVFVNPNGWLIWLFSLLLFFLGFMFWDYSH